MPAEALKATCVKCGSYGTIHEETLVCFECRAVNPLGDKARAERDEWLAEREAGRKAAVTAFEYWRLGPIGRWRRRKMLS